jgi:hypothetical protein
MLKQGLSVETTFYPRYFSVESTFNICQVFLSNNVYEYISVAAIFLYC